MKRICFVYLWATAGGVERVFLSRGEALLRRDPEFAIDVHFLHDSGGAPLFARYIRARGLAGRFAIAPRFEPERYDAIFPVDTPQVLVEHPGIHARLWMECHTPYPAHREYLKQWQSRLERLIVPSEAFRAVIEEECPQLSGKVAVVRNFVPRLPALDRALELPEWRAPLFLYLGRVDANKNVGEFTAALPGAGKKLGGAPLGIVCGPAVPDYPLRELAAKSGATGMLALLPPVPFEHSHVLLQLLQKRRAVYVSASKGESFGLSVAEAMTAGMPVVLSDIPPHRTLVAGRKKFLYELGNVEQLSEKMAQASREYDAWAAESAELARAFSEESFLADWDRVVGIQPGRALSAEGAQHR